MGDESPEWLSIAGNLSRDVALDCLLRPGDGERELVIAASQVESVDVVAGTATRARIARHLAEHPDGSVVISPPSTRQAAAHLLDLLDPLPEGVRVDGEPYSELGRFALVPATLIADSSSARTAAEFALKACEFARVAEARASVIALAVMELADNAVRHARDSSVPPVVAATVSGRERRVEIAVTDLGKQISESGHPARALGQWPGANKGNGFLPELLRLGRRHSLTVSLEAIAGTGRLRWTQERHRATTGRYVAGTTVIARVDA